MEFLTNQRKALTGLFVAAGVLVSASAFAASQCSSTACSTYTTPATCTTKAMTASSSTACTGSAKGSQQCVYSCYWDTSAGACAESAGATWQECAS